MRKTINIKCTSIGAKMVHYCICIYRGNKIVFKGISNQYGFLRVRLRRNRRYTVVVHELRDSESKIHLKVRFNIFTFRKCFDTFCVFFNNYIKNSIDVKVTDRYYPGLPIAKGELNLWQRNI